MKTHTFSVLRSLQFGRDALMGTITKLSPGNLNRIVTAISVHSLEPHREPLLALGKLTLDHRFDLLGSGWTSVSTETSRANFSNRRHSDNVRTMIDPLYRSIDWHSDFKSGFRWNSRAWHRHIGRDGTPAADIKVPLELARMQHLPRLALAYQLEPDRAYVTEFRNQVLDFASSNPPRFGVNWSSVMDVAIRAANILLAFDLFRAHGAEFDDKFHAELATIAIDHGRFVRTHLDRRSTGRDSSYLAGVAGLIFIGAYLPRTPETDRWIRFATGELIREVRNQFHPDGGNFEGATSYHRFSTETVYFATALLLGLPDPPDFPAWYCERLSRMAKFTEALTMPDGSASQIGDSDSGRFFHLTPMYRKITVQQARNQYIHLRRYEGLNDASEYWDQNELDHSHLLAAARGLFCPEPPVSLEAAAIHSLCHGRTLPVPGNARLCADAATELPPLVGHKRTVCTLPIGDSPVEHRAFPNFGVYIYSNRQFSLAIRCGGLPGVRPRGKHAHHDHLSIELHHRGEALFRDPGIYVYGPDSARHNRYRSLAAHAVPFPMEQASDQPVYQTKDVASSECRLATLERFIGRGDYGAGNNAYRCIRVSGGELEITDYLSSVPRQNSSEPLPYSPGYGKLANEWFHGGRPRHREAPVCAG